MTDRQSIWDYPANLIEPIDPDCQLTLGEGNTQISEVDGIFLKREDLNPTGSVKDRGLVYQVSYHAAMAVRSFVIPSSGNAAISAAAYCKLRNLELTAVVEPDIEQGKREILEKSEAKIVFDPQPTRKALEITRKNGSINLRQSGDPIARIGYHTIAAELSASLGEKIGHLFLPVSSGTTLLGIWEGYKLLGVKTPSLVAVQTSAIYPIACRYDHEFDKEATSLATGIVSRSAPLRGEVMRAIDETGGSGVVVENWQIAEAWQWLSDRGIIVGYEAALSVAGMRKFMMKNSIISPVCLLTGAKR